MSGRHLAACLSIHKIKTLHTALLRSAPPSSSVFLRSVLRPSSMWFLLAVRIQSALKLMHMREIYLQPFIHIWPNRHVLHAGNMLLSIGKPWENSWMFNILNYMDHQWRFSEYLPTWVVFSMSARTHHCVCYFCIAWLEAALQNFSTSVFSVGTKGIVAPVAAAAFLNLLTGPDIIKFIWWFSPTWARGVTGSRPYVDVGGRG